MEDRDIGNCHFRVEKIVASNLMVAVMVGKIAGADLESDAVAFAETAGGHPHANPQFHGLAGHE